MKTKVTLALLALAAPGFLSAQDKISVPLTNAGQPVSLKVHVIHGSVTVIGGNVSDITVETSADSVGSKRGRNHDEAAPPGMKRIDLGRFGLNIEEKNNEVSISDSGGSPGQITIHVPAKTSVSVKSTNGALSVQGVEGNLEAEATNGQVTLTAVSGTIVAHSLNGGIKAEIDHVAADQAMSFTSLNGKIDVTLPASTKARLRLKTQSGSVFSDFEMKMEAGSTPAVEDTRAENGRYRVRMDRSVTATINGGGPEYLFQTMNGSVLIHKK